MSRKVGYPITTLYIRGLTCHRDAWMCYQGRAWLVTIGLMGRYLYFQPLILTSTMLLGGRLSCYRGLTSRSLTCCLYLLNLGVKMLWAVIRRFWDFSLTGLQLVSGDWLVVVVNPDGSYLYSMPTIYQRGGLVCHHIPESRVSNHYLIYQRADLSPWCLNVLPGKGLTCHHWSDGLVLVLPASYSNLYYVVKG